MKTIELKPRYDHAASFYKKASIIIDNETAYLRSYNTIVCSIDKNGNVLDSDLYTISSY